MSMIVKQMLEDVGYEVNCLEDGEDLLAALAPPAFAECPYDILFLDWELADMTALDLLEQVAQQPSTCEHLRDLRIFIVSGNEPLDDYHGAVAQRTALRVEDWIEKPLSADRLRQIHQSSGVPRS